MILFLSVIYFHVTSGFVVPRSRHWNYLRELPFNTNTAKIEQKTWMFDTKEGNKFLLTPIFSIKDQRNYDDDSISNLDISNSKTTMMKSKDASVPFPYPTTQQHEYYLTFPQSSISKLMQMTKGQYVASKSFKATAPDGTTSSFRVLLYPRGCHATTTRRNRSSDVVGIYLQLLQSNNTRGVVDATFDLRLLGNQQGNNHPRKFHVQWSGGMRLVNASTNQGTQNNPIWSLLQTSFLRRASVASDFGGPIMLTSMLPEFMGASRTEDDEELDENSTDECGGEGELLQCYVRLTLHPPKNLHNTTSISQLRTTSTPVPSDSSRNTLLSSQISDIRHFYSPSNLNDDAIKSNEDYVRVGNVVVPVIDKWEQRERMFRLGVYPGVDYRILRIFSHEGKEIFYSEPNAVYELKPIYPLVEELERPWPVQVEESKIPKLLTTTMYNNISAGASLATAFLGLLTAYTISQLISIFVIPSKSMDPTLQVGDVLLVEKVTPRLLKRNNHPGDVVLFHPPRKLQDIVTASGGHIHDRDLFIKRVLAKPGDVVDVKPNGDITLNGQPPKERRDLCGAEPLKLIERYVTAGESVIQDNEIFVSGDCSSVSVDSRVWGPLSTEEVIGKPLFRIWPLERIGSISKLPLLDISEPDWRD